MSCKNCSDVTLLSGNDGNGIQTVIDNGDGTFTFFFTDGSTFTTPDFSGTPGTPGAAATITVGTVTIGPPGTPPSVTNSGTSEAAVFDFVFPIGIGYGKTLWVDDQFGDDTTALRDRIDLPYKTIGAAITAAVADDTVHIRTNSYTEDITLKNLVNIYCDEGVVINGKITDGGVQVVSVISGNGILQDTDSGSDCIQVTGNGSDIKIRLERITNSGTTILQRADSLESSKLIVETEIISGNIVNYFLTVGGNVDCTIKVNQYAETGVSTGSSPFFGVDARASASSPDGFSGTLNFSCPKMVIENGTNTDGGVALYIEASTTSTARVFFNVDQIINNYDQPTYDSVPGAQNNALGTLNLNGDGKYIINVKDCYSKSRVGLMVGVGDAIGGPGVPAAIATGITIFEGMIFSLKSAAVRMCNLNDINNKARLIVRNSSLSRGIDPGASIALPDRDSVVIFGDSGFGTQALGGSPVAFAYMYAEFINTQIVKILDNPLNLPIKVLDTAPAGGQGLVCIQKADTTLTTPINSIYFRGCDLINGGDSAASAALSAVVGYSQEDVLYPIQASPPYDTKVYFKDTCANMANIVTGNPGAIDELNVAGGFTVETTSIRTLNYLHVE